MITRPVLSRERKPAVFLAGEHSLLTTCLRLFFSVVTHNVRAFSSYSAVTRRVSKTRRLWTPTAFRRLSTIAGALKRRINAGKRVWTGEHEKRRVGPFRGRHEYTCCNTITTMKTLEYKKKKRFSELATGQDGNTYYLFTASEGRETGLCTIINYARDV